MSLRKLAYLLAGSALMLFWSSRDYRKRTLKPIQLTSPLGQVCRE